jgi:hypothetical protein
LFGFAGNERFFVETASVRLEKKLALPTPFLFNR